MTKNCLLLGAKLSLHSKVLFKSLQEPVTLLFEISTVYFLFYTTRSSLEHLKKFFVCINFHTQNFIEYDLSLIAVIVYPVVVERTLKPSCLIVGSSCVSSRFDTHHEMSDICT